MKLKYVHFYTALAPGSDDGVPGLAANTEHWGAWHRPTLQYLSWSVGRLEVGEWRRTPVLWESVGRWCGLAGKGAVTGRSTI